MSTLVFSSQIYRGLYADEAMQAVFSDAALVQRWLDVEVALARVQAEQGLIPQAAAAEIAVQAQAGRVDFARLRARTEVVGYPILPLVEQLTEWCADGLGQYCHWGATTQDIMDTADILQARAGLELVREALRGISESLGGLAERWAETPMAGRTHLQHATPITFGYKCACWLAGIERCRERLEGLLGPPGVLAGQFAGASGVLSSLGAEGLAVQEALMDALGLGRPAITWHTLRDSLAEVSGFLALACAVLGKLGLDVMLLMQTELGEVFEPYLPGRGASSTMPQKRNPIACEMLLAAAKITRSHHGAMLDAMLQDHERATGPWNVEWWALPECFLAASGALAHARFMLAGLEVHPQAMRRNLEHSGGLIAAEGVMMALAPALGRTLAHDVVYACCRRALEEKQPFLETLLADEAVQGSGISRQALAELLDPARHTGSAAELARRVVAARRP